MTYLPAALAIWAVVAAQEAGMRNTRGQTFVAGVLLTLALAMAIGAGILAHSQAGCAP